MGQFDAAWPDADLVRAALGGAREALAELVRRHWDAATFLAARVLGSAELGRDAAQEAALAALTDLGRLRSPDRFGAWFCGIALNVSRRWLRQRRAEVPGVPADRASASPGPDEIAESAEVAARVRAAVAALPNGQQHAVLLFYLQGMSHREVAGELGISVGAVKSRLHQARAALAPALASMADLPRKPVARHPGERTMMADTQWVEVSVSGIRREDVPDTRREDASAVRSEGASGIRSEGASGIRGEGEENVPHRKHIMILSERGGDRWLPVWIGQMEATALALALEAVETPRPFTYKLAAGLVEAAGSRLAEVRIARLLDEVYYASVVVAGPAGTAEVDARPSDAVNLALAAGAPIRVDSELFGLGLTDDHAERLSSCPVATAEIAEEARRLMTVRSRPPR